MANTTHKDSTPSSSNHADDSAEDMYISSQQETQAFAPPMEPSEEDKKPGLVDKLRVKWPVFDHLMRMNERYGEKGGNQFAAGITYFSILSMIPILLLLFSAAGFFLASNPNLQDQLFEQIDSVGAALGDDLQNVILAAVDQRASVGIIGLVSAIWTGLGWINNLRIATSTMWDMKPTKENFIKVKVKDFFMFLALLFSLILAAVVVGLSSTGGINRILELLHLDQVPGAHSLATILSIVISILVNTLVLFFLVWKLPRQKVPWKPIISAALVGGLVLQVVKFAATPLFASALNNPAGRAFGPIIGLMLIFYILWRVLLYCSTWAATSLEGMASVPEAELPPVYVTIQKG